MPFRCQRCGQLIEVSPQRPICPYCQTLYSFAEPSVQQHHIAPQLFMNQDDYGAQAFQQAQDTPLYGNLTNCPDCGSLVSTNAKHCLKCGAKIKKTPAWLKAGIITAVVAMLVISLSLIAVKAIQQQEETASQQRIEQQETKSKSDLKSILSSHAGGAARMCDDIMALWHNSIFDEGRRTALDSDGEILDKSELKQCCSSDFNKAISNYLSSSKVILISKSITDAQREAKECMNKMSDPTIYEQKAFEYYNKLVDLATSPSGNYTTYTTNVNNACTEFNAAIQML